MKKRVRIILINLFIVAISGLLIFVFISILFKKPIAKKYSKHDNEIIVNVETLIPTTYQVQMQKYGQIKTKLKSKIYSEVNGKVFNINSDFQLGKFIAKGKSLIQVDSSNYQLALSQAQNQLSQAQLNYDLELAKSKQAQLEWKKFGNPNKKPSDLTIRIPYLKEKKAALNYAKNNLKQAKLNLAKVNIKTPYNAIVLLKNIEQGEYVSVGKQIAEIYSTDELEVEFTVSYEELKLLNLDKVFEQLINGKIKNTSQINAKVTIQPSENEELEWQGEIRRIIPAINNNQQIKLVASIKQPFSKYKNQILFIDQFVKIKVQGITLKKVYVIPLNLISQNNVINVVGDDDIMRKKQINIIYRDDTTAVIDKGIVPNERIVLTSIGQLNHVKVKVIKTVRE